MGNTIGDTIVLTDAACDMPRSMIDQLGLGVVPFRIRAGELFVEDRRDEAALPQLYRKYLVDKQDHYAESIPLLEREIEDFLLKHVVTQHDRALLLTIASSRSHFYSHATGAVVGTTAKSFKPRKDAGRSGLFELTVVDTGAIGPGQALMVHEAARMLREGAEVRDVVHVIENRLRDASHVYLVPDELLYMYTRAKQKGEKSITWGRYMMGTAFNVRPLIHMHRGDTEAIVKVRGSDEGIRRLLAHTETMITEERLATPVVAITYSGSLDTVRRMEPVQALMRTAQEHGVEVLLAPMSLTVALNVGANAFSVGYLSDSPVPI